MRPFIQASGVTHETIRAWEVRFAPLLADQLRAKRRSQAGGSWYLDETYVTARTPMDAAVARSMAAAEALRLTL